jgi:hypothetical protein
MAVKILSSAHPWLDRQRSSSFPFGDDLVSLAADRRSLTARLCSAAARHGLRHCSPTASRRTYVACLLCRVFVCYAGSVRLSD